MDSLLDKILVVQKTNLFYKLVNAEKKCWIIPKHNIRTAMNLYQPSSLKGKFLKSVFPYLHHWTIICRILHIELKHYALNKHLYSVLSSTINNNDLEFSIFCGTPCVHQKITIQLSCGKQILGYCKVTDSPEIKDIFRHEAKTLYELRQQGINSIPSCFYCGPLNDNVDLFVQTTIKTNNATVDHEWGMRQEEFIRDLYKKTRRTLAFEQTDFYTDLYFLHDHLSNLEVMDKQAVEAGINKVMNVYAGNEVTFSVYHADFTPWNMFVEKGRLFVFDFEYAKRTYPAYLDYFHFFMQTSIFEKHWGATEIWAKFERDIPILKLKFADVRLAFLCYLLSVLSQYVKREKGNFTGDISRNMKIWTTLIARL